MASVLCCFVSNSGMIWQHFLHRNPYTPQLGPFLLWTCERNESSLWCHYYESWSETSHWRGNILIIQLQSPSLKSVTNQILKATKRRCSKLELEASVCGVISHTDAEDLTWIFEHTIALSAKKEDESVSVNYEITSLKNPIEPREVNWKVSEIRSAICQLFEVLRRQPGLGYFKF